MDLNNLIIRCSSLGSIMTEGRTKGELSETCKTALLDIYVEQVLGRKKDIFSKYLSKGLMVEEDSITLYSRVTKTFYKKNEENIKNEFISGTPDLYDGKTIQESSLIIDIKSSWDLFTFTKAKHSKLNKAYYWQLQGYMALTGAKNAKLAYCLVDTPEMLIQDEKRRLMWKIGAIDENEMTDEAFAEIEKNMIFEDIPMKERVFEIDIERNDEDIEKIYDRVKQCRDELKKY